MDKCITSSVCLVLLLGPLIINQLQPVDCDVVTFSPYKNKSLPSNGTSSLPDESIPRPKRQSVTTQSETCSLTPMSTEGPYYLKDVLERSDITDGKQGVPLNLTLTVMDAVNQCRSLSGLRVDIWHADALGVYSGVGQTFLPRGRRANSRASRFPASPVDRFLRGYQITNTEGQVNFKTIVPGWYPGRPIHIHFEVYSPSGKLVHVGQLYFEESLTSSLETIEPYSKNPTKHVLNVKDRIFNSSSGHKTILILTGQLNSQMESKYGIGLDLAATVPVNFG